MLDEFLKANLGLWNEWTEIHETSAFYDLEGFQGGQLVAAFDRARRARRGGRQAPAAPAVPLRPRHAVVGAPGGDRHRRRLLGARHRAGPLAVGRARPAGHVRAVDRRRARRATSPAPSTSSSPPTAPSSGSPTCSAGRTRSPTSWRPAAPSTWSSCTRWPARSTTSTPTPSCASWAPTFRQPAAAPAHPRLVCRPRRARRERPRLRLDPQLRRDPERPDRRRAAPRVPARVPLLGGALQPLHGARARRLVLPARRPARRALPVLAQGDRRLPATPGQP